MVSYAVSGRAGLFTMDDGKFFGDLRGMPYTASKRQKSGALRMEFGAILVPTAATTQVSAKVSINTGIMALVTPDKVVDTTAVVKSGGSWIFSTAGFVSGVINATCQVTGEYSGKHSGMCLNYLVIGY